MPWCPKCKSEYREGFTVCADCGSELVDEEQLAELEARRLETERKEMLALEGLEIRELEEAQETDAEQGPFGAYDGLQEAETDRDRLEPGETVGPNGQTAAKQAGYPAAMYQDSRERASENRSSAWILLIMGSAGIVIIALGIMGVLPLKFSNPYLFYGVMAAVFALFLVAGIVSLKNARIFDKKAESENSLRDAMLAWCRENLCAKDIDGEIGANATESEEALYFKRFESIKMKLNYQFVNLDQGFLEKFIDDSVYDMVFEKKEELT